MEKAEQLTSITSIPTGLQILLKDLDYLSQIPRGFKPCVSSRDFVDASSWSGWFYRTFMVRESRKDVLSEIEKIVERSVDAIKQHKETDHLKIIIIYFYKARTGVANLLATYKDSPDIISRINVQLTIMDLQIKKYKNYIDGYSQEEDVKKIEEKNLNKDILDLTDPNESTAKKFKKPTKLKKSTEL